MAEIHTGRDCGSTNAGRTGRDDLAERRGELARQLREEREESSILARMAHAGVDLVPGVQQASISLVIGRKKIEARAPSGQMAREVDALQERVGQGTCLDAAFEHPIDRVPEVATEVRWPWVAAETFDDESEEIALLVAAHAAVVPAGTQQANQLRGVAVSRDVIGQAKGVLMERYQITDAHAFLLLARASSRTNTKVIQVAEHLTGSGELPSDEERPVKP